MTFSSELFLFALLPILLASMLLNQNQRNTQQVMILLANICFGLWSGFGGLVLILAMTGGTFLLVRFWILPGERGRLALTITLLCLPLLFFKYTAFLIGNVNALFRISLSVPDLMLPLGISFYTFQAISLVVDVYRGEVCEVRFREVLLYLTFFPTVTSGPILRFTPFREGLASPVRYRDWNGALFRFVIGLSKKVLIADRLALLADYYFDGIAAGGSYSAAGLWLGSIAYSLQLYFDFSGYSDMAIGIGAMLGVSIPENFSQPYLASSISDFWRRWHKSLTSWFRDYIYIPLGGNRVSIAKHLRNMLIVWLITGIWHGANWTFVVWGLGYFVLLVLEKYLPIHGHGAEKPVPIHGHGAEKPVPRHGNGSIRSVLGHVYTLFFVNLLWVLFRAKDLACAGVYLRGMFTLQGTAPEAFALRFAPFLCACIALIPIGALVFRKQEKSGAFIASEAAAQATLKKARPVTEILRTIVLMLLFVFCAAAVMNSAYTPFIYGNF